MGGISRRRGDFTHIILAGPSEQASPMPTKSFHFAIPSPPATLYKDLSCQLLLRDISIICVVRGLKNVDALGVSIHESRDFGHSHDH